MIVAVASIITTTPATAQYRSKDNLHAEYTSGPFLVAAATQAGEYAPGKATLELTIKGELARARLPIARDGATGPAIVAHNMALLAGRQKERDQQEGGGA